MAKVRQPKPRRPKRPDLLDTLVHPTLRFVWGLALIAVLVLAPRWETRAAVMLLGAVLATLAGKRISFGYFLVLAGTVVFFHLLAPFGKVLASPLGFPLTEGALLGGWKNGLTMAGLVFVSLGTISRKLHLPGRFGELWALTFAWYERLMESKNRIHPRAILLSVDRILEHHYPTLPRDEGDESASPLWTAGLREPHTATTVWGWLLVLATILATTTLGVLLK
ncbi:MAG: hypothetical protein WCG80_16560 [Spirochaetales bacterium]